MELDLQTPLTFHHHDAVPYLFDSEGDHMPSAFSFHSSNLRFSVRRRAVALVSDAKFSYDLDSFLVYLAVNYIDRFVSKNEILEKRPWISNILAVASLSLAAKMTNSDLSVLLSNLPREEGFQFDARSVQRMETIILATLQWRMRSITPFSFLHYFISLLKIEDSFSTQALIRQASDIVLHVQHVLKMLEHMPSVTAASALLCAIQNLMPHRISSYRAAISSCEYLNQGKLCECLAVMQEILSDGFDPYLHATEMNCPLTPVSDLNRQIQCTRSDSYDASSNQEFPPTERGAFVLKPSNSEFL